MRERVSSFETRTGLRYDPPEALRQMAPALGPGEACPTLFRHPGPRGLAGFLRGSLATLGPPESSWVWLAETETGTSRRPAQLFGVVAVLQPLRLSPCRLPGRQGHWLAANRPLAVDEPLVWVPPSAVRAGASWDRIRDPAQAARRFGRGLAEERAAVLDALDSYLEELSALQRAGAPPVFGPWCGVSRPGRRRLLAAHGVEGRWTR